MRRIDHGQYRGDVIYVDHCIGEALPRMRVEGAMVVAILKRDRLDAIGRYHTDAVKVRRLNQPVQPAFECEAVEHEDVSLAHGTCIRRDRLVDMSIAIGPHERRDGNMIPADALDHVSQYRKGGNHRDGVVGPGRCRGGQRKAYEGDCGLHQAPAAGH